MPAKGYKKQFCKYGHDTFVCGRDKKGVCRNCVKRKSKENRQKIKEGHKSKPIKQFCPKGHDTFIIGRNKNGRCKECQKVVMQIYNQSYYTINKEHKKKYQKDHPAMAKLASLKCSTNRNLRIPSFGQRGIKEFYINCLQDMVVDHIIPLQGKTVSGLHVRWNLQYLTPKENSKKNNHIELDWASKWYGKILEQEGLK